MKVNTMFNGRQPKERCRYIDGVYYLIGSTNQKDSGGCYLMPNGRYNRVNNGLIEWDYVGNEYSFKKNLVHGYISKTQMGWFSKSDGQVTSGKGVVHYFGFEPEFDKYTGKYYLGDVEKVRKQFGMAPNCKTYENFDVNSNHCFKNLKSSVVKKLKTCVKKNRDATPYTKFYKELGDLSFGIELETSKNVLPEKYLLEYGFAALRDGSISGNEFASVPFTGNQLDNVYHFCNILKEHSSVDYNCSLHNHIGNIPNTKSFAVAIYMLYAHLQNEIFQLNSPYRYDFKYQKKQRKNYCKAIPDFGLLGNTKIDVNKVFKLIFTIYNDDQAPDSNHNFDTRRHVRHGSNKWTWNGRYYNLNLCNYFFENSKTVEFRPYNGTTDKHKVMKWLFINAAIVKFVTQNEKAILNKNIELPNLTELVEIVYSNKLAKILTGFINERLEYYNNLKMTGSLGLEEEYKQDSFDFKSLRPKGNKNTRKKTIPRSIYDTWADESRSEPVEW